MSSDSIAVATVPLLPSGSVLTPEDLERRRQQGLREMSAVLAPQKHLHGRELTVKYAFGEKRLELVCEIGPARQQTLPFGEGVPVDGVSTSNLATLVGIRDKLVGAADKAQSRINILASSAAATASRGEGLPEFTSSADAELWSFMCRHSGKGWGMTFDGQQLNLSIPLVPSYFSDTRQHTISGFVKNIGESDFTLTALRDIGLPAESRRPKRKRVFSVALTREHICGGVPLIAGAARWARTRIEIRARAALDKETGEVAAYELVEVMNYAAMADVLTESARKVRDSAAVA